MKYMGYRKHCMSPNKRNTEGDQGAVATSTLDLRE
jgi:hypothetical protein